MTYRSFEQDKQKIRNNWDESNTNQFQIIDQNNINIKIDGKIKSIEPLVQNFKNLQTIDSGFENMEIIDDPENPGIIFLLRQKFEIEFKAFDIRFIHTLNPEIVSRVGDGDISGDNENFQVQFSTFHQKQIIFDIKDRLDPNSTLKDITIVASLVIAKRTEIANLPPYQSKLVIQILNPNEFV